MKRRTREIGGSLTPRFVVLLVQAGGSERRRFLHVHRV
jgi:hypothetical protein